MKLIFFSPYIHIRCLPMNFDLDNLAKSAVLRDRQKIGSSLADIDPMTIDRSVSMIQNRLI